MGKKDKEKNKKSDKTMIDLKGQLAQDGKNPAQRNKNDVKEVLHLFSKLEELVVDGDPRVKEALNQKPGIAWICQKFQRYLSDATKSTN